MQRLSTILIVLALAAPPASVFAGQQTQAERERAQAQRDREQAQRDRQQERDRAQRERDQERDKDRRNNTRETQTDRITKTLNIGAEGEIDLSNIAGDIVVTRGGGTSAAIEVIKTAQGPEPRETLALVNVDIVERGNRVEIRTLYPDSDVLRSRNRRNINVDVSFNIAVPPKTRLTIKSISGDISVRDVSGAVSLESTSGSVRLVNAGRVTAKSISGDVEAIDTRIDGPLEASTISGAVRLRRTTVQGVTASSVSGDVVLEEVGTNRISGQTISGTVTFAGDLVANGRYELSSHSGTVRVALSGKTGFQVEATSFSGSINTEFPLTMSGNSSRPRNVRATYGDGAAILKLTAFSGSVFITKR
jgi:putative adhesin